MLRQVIESSRSNTSNEAVYEELAKAFVGFLHAERPRKARELKSELASIILRLRSDVGYVRREFRRLIDR